MHGVVTRLECFTLSYRLGMHYMAHRRKEALRLTPARYRGFGLSFPARRSPADVIDAVRPSAKRRHLPKRARCNAKRLRWARYQHLHSLLFMQYGLAEVCKFLRTLPGRSSKVWDQWLAREWLIGGLS